MPTGNLPDPSPLRRLMNAGAIRQTCIRVQAGWADWKMIQRIEFDYPGYEWWQYQAVLGLAKTSVGVCKRTLNPAKDAFLEIPDAPLLPP